MIAADASGHIVGYDRVGYLAVAVTLAAVVFVGQIRMYTNVAPTGGKTRGRPTK